MLYYYTDRYGNCRSKAMVMPHRSEPVVRDYIYEVDGRRTTVQIINGKEVKSPREELCFRS
jgi:hypothetical protein